MSVIGEAERWVELAGKVTVLVTVIVGAREARQGHRRGLINTEKIEHIEDVVNGKPESSSPDPQLPV